MLSQSKYSSKSRYFLCAILVVAVSLFGYSQKRESKISLLTIAPGNEVSDCFGHTGVKISTGKSANDYVYNYGTYSFDQPNFILNFVRGKLLYSLSKQSFPAFLQYYHNEKRTIYEQKLNLTPEEEVALLAALEQNYLPENKTYLYDFFFDNCSTRPRIVIENALQSVTYNEEVTPKTFRELLEEYTQSRSWLDFGIDLIIGNIADRQANREEQMFLPDYLHDYLGTAVAGSDRIVTEDYLVLDFITEGIARKQKALDIPLIIFSLFALFELFLLLGRKQPRWAAIYDKCWYSILGLGALIILIMWLGTDHIATKSNWNILWMSPIYFFVLVKPKSKMLHYGVIGLLLVTSLLQAFGIQQFHWAVLPICLVILLKSLRLLFSKEKNF
jgi:hypothetical protein